MKRGRLFFLEHIINYYKRKDIKLRGKIKMNIEIKHNGINMKFIKMYKKYFRIKNTILRLENKYLDLAISLS